jgi:twitching motility protein PilJ
MGLAQNKRQEGRLSVPCILLTLSLLALVVSLVGLQRATSIANDRLGDLRLSWAELQDGPIEGSELVETSRLMDTVSQPIPAASSAAQWSLALALTSLLFVFWLLYAVRRDHQARFALSVHDAEDEKAAVLKLTDEVTPLAHGDLRVKASVDQNLSAPLADTFNHLSSELRWLVTTISSSAHQVKESVQNCRQAHDNIVNDANRQSEYIHQSSNFLLSMAGTMAELSSSASEESSVARTVAERAERSKSAVNDSFDSFQACAANISEIDSLMDRLGNTMRTVDEQIVAVQEVAKRTELLALNTTIRVSAGADTSSGGKLAPDTASDIGKLSDEVAQMAELLAQASREIEASSHSASRDVAVNRQLLGEAKGQLDKWFAASGKTSALLERIAADSAAIESYLLGLSQSNVKNSGLVSQLTEELDDIIRITQAHISSVSIGSASLDDLERLSDELQAAVIEFKLPVSTLSSEDEKTAASDARRAADRAVIHG